MLWSILSLAGCASTSSTSTNATAQSGQSSTINFNDARHGLHLEYPATWIEQGVPASGQVLLILQLPESGKAGDFPPTVQLSAQSGGAQLTLAEIENAVIEHGKNSFADFKILSNSGATFGNEPARQIVYRGSSNGIALQTLTLVTQHRGQGFALSYAADPREFDQFHAAVDRMIDSISFN